MTAHSPLRILPIALVGGAIAACAIAMSCQAAQPMTVVPQVDLQRYQGTWYEIARLPMFFERKCVRDVTAHYTLNADKTVAVLNQCSDKHGTPKQARGQATVGASISQLKVTFLPKGLRGLPLGKADYWILKLDGTPEQGYTVALVGEPRRRYMWILSRTPTLDSATLNAFIQAAQAQGYDTSKLIYPRQHAVTAH